MFGLPSLDANCIFQGAIQRWACRQYSSRPAPTRQGASVRETGPNSVHCGGRFLWGVSAGASRVVDGGGPRLVSLLFLASPGGFEPTRAAVSFFLIATTLALAFSIRCWMRWVVSSFHPAARRRRACSRPSS